MTTIDSAPKDAMTIDGALGASVVDADSGMALGSLGTAHDLELAAAGTTDMGLRLFLYLVLDHARATWPWPATPAGSRPSWRCDAAASALTPGCARPTAPRLGQPWLALRGTVGVRMLIADRGHPRTPVTRRPA
ncbi:hypothetical protein ACWC9T_29050 [Kitasatospora sp. NPDC001159]